MNGERPLTVRQRQVLGLLRRGAENKEIAHTLGISVSTVKEHIVDSCRRLGVENRVQAALAWERLCRAAEDEGSGTVSPVPPGSVRVTDLRPVEPELPLPQSPENLFWMQVERSPEPDGCWIWRGPCAHVGAGLRPECHLRALRHLGHSARRIAYMLVHGVLLPKEVLVRPDCPRNNRRCVNPAHAHTTARGGSPEWLRWKVRSS